MKCKHCGAEAIIHNCYYKELQILELALDLIIEDTMGCSNCPLSKEKCFMKSDTSNSCEDSIADYYKEYAKERLEEMKKENKKSLEERLKRIFSLPYNYEYEVGEK